MRIMEYIRRYAPVIIVVCLLLVVAVGVIVHHSRKDDKAPKVITIEQAKDPLQLSKAINVTPKDGATIIREVERATPITTYYVPSKTVQAAAEVTRQQIARNDSSLPSAVTAKSDRTVIVENTDKQKVDVYKINLRNNHKIKSGVTYIDGKMYGSVGYQAGRVEAVVHADQTGLKGGTALYTIKEW
ncbi:MAG: hypothetical protein KH107_06300 [Megasphaera micronuciformis]|nr:hypothetical protein [Megasphaera micronuciformis]